MKTQSTLKQSTLKINTSKAAASKSGSSSRHSSTNKLASSSTSTPLFSNVGQQGAGELTTGRAKGVHTFIASAVAASNGQSLTTEANAILQDLSKEAATVDGSTVAGAKTNHSVPKPELFANVFKRSSRTNVAGTRLYLVPQHATPESVDLAPAEPTILRSNQRFYALEKRAVDLLGAVIMLVVLSPVMVVLSILIYLTSGAPIIYRQQRLTVGGKHFTIYKFRTMKVGAEIATGPVFASENDPRVTKLGRFMRRTRLDELPQLFNVLFGSMSLIGPRPERPELAEQLESSIPRFHQRLRTKAGLTGLAQVHQGYPDGVDGYRRKLALDLLYIKKQSVVLDLWIAVRTIGVVLSGSGAR